MYKYKAIIWDLDGTLIDSNEIKTDGFRILFSEHERHMIEALIDYHEENGGLSRYDKIKFFYKKNYNEKISDRLLFNLANNYSEIVMNNLKNPKLLFNYSKKLISEFKLDNILVTASDQNEAIEVLEFHGIKCLFSKIYGSPTNKLENLKNVLKDYSLINKDIVYVGDSINDLNFCNELSIDFIGINNYSLVNKAQYYLSNGNELDDLKKIVCI